MLEHLKTLTSLYGISGDEKQVRDYIISVVRDKCEYHTDNLGNLIVFKKGKKTPKNRIMIAAHMDEVGLIVKNINPDGTLGFDTVGGINTDVIAGRHVYLYNKGLYGAVGGKAVHNMSSEERKSQLSLSGMYIDIGAESRDEAEKLVSPGECVSFVAGYDELGGGKICSKAIDDRAGCAVMLDLIENFSEFDIYYAFTVQEELGLRGAGPAAYSVDPDIAVVIESTTASDIPGCDGAGKVCTVGGGAVVSFMDRRTLYDRELYQLAFLTAEENSIKCQTKTMVAGGNDSGVIHISRGGIRTVSVSAPCRYLHSPATVASLEDIEACEALVKKLIPRIVDL